MAAGKKPSGGPGKPATDKVSTGRDDARRRKAAESARRSVEKEKVEGQPTVVRRRAAARAAAEAKAVAAVTPPLPPQPVAVVAAPPPRAPSPKPPPRAPAPPPNYPSVAPSQASLRPGAAQDGAGPEPRKPLIAPPGSSVGARTPADAANGATSPPRIAPPGTASRASGRQEFNGGRPTSPNPALGRPAPPPVRAGQSRGGKMMIAPPGSSSVGRPDAPAPAAASAAPAAPSVATPAATTADNKASAPATAAPPTVDQPADAAPAPRSADARRRAKRRRQPRAPADPEAVAKATPSDASPAAPAARAPAAKAPVEPLRSALPADTRTRKAKGLVERVGAVAPAGPPTKRLQSAVSVVVISRNHATLLADRFASLSGIITAVDTRWWLLDLGSVDPSVAVAEQHRAGVISVPGGLVEPLRTLDAAMARCGGDVVVFVDAQCPDLSAASDLVARVRAGAALVSAGGGHPAMVAIARKPWQTTSFAGAFDLRDWADKAGLIASTGRSGVGADGQVQGLVERALDRRPLRPAMKAAWQLGAQFAALLPDQMRRMLDRTSAT